MQFFRLACGKKIIFFALKYKQKHIHRNMKFEMVMNKQLYISKYMHVTYKLHPDILKVIVFIVINTIISPMSGYFLFVLLKWD